MITSDIVPSYAVVVNVIENRKARLGCAVYVELGVVRLSYFLVSGLRPWVVGPAVRRLVGRCHLLTVCRPEPSVESFRLEVPSILATFEVAETTGRPDVWHIVCWK